MDISKADAKKATAKAEDALTKQKDLEKQNLKLRTELEETIAETNVGKQKLAKTQIDVAEARRHQADAERALAELRERLRPRTLTIKQREQFVATLQKTDKCLV